MNDFDKHSRVDKFEKRRKNTKSISVLMIAGSLLVVVLLGIWIFGGGDDQASEEEQSSETEQANETDNNDTEQTNETNEEETETGDDNATDSEEQENEDSNQEDSNTETEDEENQSNDDVETEDAEPTGENAIEAYTGNWEPIGTEQEGPHTTNYSDGSQDRQEIASAAAMATGLNASTMTTHWVGNGGDQKVETTVHNDDQSEIYRVYLSWVDNEGWQPTKVEVLNNLPPIN